MNFLAPLFLAGAAALAAPILFHLIRRSTRERIPFGSLFLLRATPPRMRKRSRLEDVLLLLLRCLALVLLVLGFSRPFFRSSTPATPISQPNQRIVLLVDTSASMRRAGLWNVALDAADKTTRTLAAGDLLSLVTFDRESRSLISFDAWKATPSDRRPALVAAQLKESGPTWSSTSLGQALIGAAETLGERSDDPASLVRRIVLITDLQEGCHLDPLQAYEWPKGITLHVERVQAAGASKGNVGLQLLTDTAPAAPASTNASLRLRLTATPELAAEKLEVGWAKTNASGSGSANAALDAVSAPFLSTPIEVRLEPGTQKVIPIPVPANSGSDRIVLRGDGDPFDNVVYVVPPAPAKSGLLYLGDDSPADARLPLYFLQRAFPPTNALGLTLEVRPTSAGPGPDDARAALAIATGALPAETANRLHNLAAQGGTILFAPRLASAETAATLGQILGGPAPNVEEAPVKAYAMLGEIDFRHPLLAAFSNPRFSDFTKIHFWHHRRFDSNTVARARVIARFDSGDPAWMEFPIERGRVFVFASGWHPDDSQLALSTKFVPILFGMLEADGNIAGLLPRAYTVGDSIPMPQAATGANSTLRRPDRTTSQLAPGTTNLPAITQPGVYTVVSGDTSTRFAVNLDPTESRTQPLPTDDLERLGVRLKEVDPEVRPTAERTAELAAAEVEGRQKLWRWCLIAALVAVFLESSLAGWITRRVAPAPDATSATV